MWKTFEIVHFTAFYCFQSVVHVVSERKCCTLYLENLCNLSCSKNRNPCLNYYCLIALTSVVMKCFERIILHQLMKHTKRHLDPHQFAYTHPEKTGSFVRILFIDFSSALSTIQPHLMASKLLKLDVNPRMILWIVDFVVNRSQTVRHQPALSSSRTVSTGSPQGTVLSPILFTLYTNDNTGTDTTPVIKYSDDSAMEDLSNSDSVYFAEVESSVNGTGIIPLT